MQLLTLIGVQETVTVKLFIELNGYWPHWTIKAVDRKGSFT